MNRFKIGDCVYIIYNNKILVGIIHAITQLNSSLFFYTINTESETIKVPLTNVYSSYNEANKVIKECKEKQILNHCKYIETIEDLIEFVINILNQSQNNFDIETEVIKRKAKEFFNI